MLHQRTSVKVELVQCWYLQKHSTITVQKDVRKLRQKPNKGDAAAEESDSHKIDHGPKTKPKTPRAKKKADATLMEKRKR